MIREPHTDFPFDELDGPHEDKPEERSIEALRRLFVHVVGVRHHGKRTAEIVGCRMLALCIVVHPGLLGGKSVAEIADVCGIPRSTLYAYVESARRLYSGRVGGGGGV